MIAAEMAPDHPTARLWQERRVALFVAGYIETRVLRSKRSELRTCKLGTVPSGLDATLGARMSHRR